MNVLAEERELADLARVLHCELGMPVYDLAPPVRAHAETLGPHVLIGPISSQEAGWGDEARETRLGVQIWRPEATQLRLLEDAHTLDKIFINLGWRPLSTVVIQGDLHTPRWWGVEVAAEKNIRR